MKKIICSVHQYNNIINYDFVCLDKNAQVVVIDAEFSMTIDINDNFSVDFLRQKSVELTQKLEAIDYAKKPLVVNLNLKNTFTETVGFPKLSFLEFKKTFNIEMEKIYTNFNKRFCYSYTVETDKNKGHEVTVMMCEKMFYSKALYIPNNCGCKVEKVLSVPHSLKQFVLENNFFEKDSNFVYVNIGKKYSTVIFAKGNKLINYDSFNLGTSDIDDEIAVVKGISVEEARKLRLEGSMENEIILTCKATFQPISTHVELLGGCYPTEEIDTIRIHSEDYSDAEIVKAMAKDLKVCTAAPSVLEYIAYSNYVTLSALSIPDKNYDPDLPVTVKVNE